LTVVSIDENGVPQKVPSVITQSIWEKEREQGAQERRAKRLKDKELIQTYIPK
jgi:acyl-CoA hydrolase